MSKEGFALRVALIEKTGVVEILGDPGFEIFQVTKVDDETVGISFLTGEGEGCLLYNLTLPTIRLV